MEAGLTERSADTRIGLCAMCEHVRITGNRRGSRFYLCSLSETDSRFKRYPPLPVLHCEGFLPKQQDVPSERENDA